ARYFDIIKDRLYTFAPRNIARRSAQTVLYGIADALARLLAPILVFTADEVWENLPQAGKENERLASVHLATFPESTNVQDMELNQIKVERASGAKCERCWNYSTRVGESERYPTACERCVEALREIEEGAAP